MEQRGHHPRTLRAPRGHLNGEGGRRGKKRGEPGGPGGPKKKPWADRGPSGCELLRGLTAGTYTVAVTDGHSCTASLSVTVGQPAALALSETHVDVSCNSGSNGAIDLSVAGGTAPYSYNWSNGATTQDLSGLAAGTYTVTVTDGHSCTASLGVTVGDPTALALAESEEDVSCRGSSNNAIVLSVAGGTSPYSYDWSN